MLIFNASNSAFVRLADFLSDSCPMKGRANACGVVFGLQKNDVLIKLFTFGIVIKTVLFLKHQLLTNYPKRLPDNDEKVPDYSTCISIAHDDDC